MALNPGLQFDETTLTAAEFDPQDKVLPNSKVESNDVNAIALRALRRTAYLNSIKANLSGATFTGMVNFNAGATVPSGQTLYLDSANVFGDVGFSPVGRARLGGRKQVARARVILADSNHTITCDQGDRFELPASNAAPRTITLSTGGAFTIASGEMLTFFWNPGGAGGGGAQYTFVRQDLTVVATFVGAQLADTGAVFAEFEYLTGTGFKLGKHSGTINEYVPPVPGPESWDSYGVVPGAGA
jgi:hypothetical protein